MSHLLLRQNEMYIMEEKYKMLIDRFSSCCRTYTIMIIIINVHRVTMDVLVNVQ